VKSQFVRLYLFVIIFNMKGSYAAALNAPFSEAALGAQIPDIFSYPTDTKHFRQTFTITTDASGNWEGVILPSPVFSIAAPFQATSLSGGGPALGKTITGGQSLFSDSSFIPISRLHSSGSGDTPAMQVNACVKIDTLSAIYQQYRVVGWGYKMRAISSVNSTSGRVQFASIPAPRRLPDAAFFNNTSAGRPNGVANFVYPMYDFYTSLFGNFGSKTNRGDVIDQFKVPVSGAALNSSFGGDILDYPINVEVTSLQLASAPLRGHGKLTTRDFESFRETQAMLGTEMVADLAADELFYDSWQVGLNGPSNYGVNSLATTNTAHGFGLQANSCAGWNAILISVLGATPSATNFEIELMYHVEGINPLSLNSDSPLGGKAVHHNPIEAMAAETVNGASGKYPCFCAS